GSPGSARFRTKVTMTTPTMPGTASSSRRPQSRSIGVAVPLLFLELAVVKRAVEPVLVPGDILLHRHVEERLVERYAGHVGDLQAREGAHEVGVLLRVALEARRVDELVHLGALIRRRVEDGVLTVEVPEEEVLRVVEPAAEGVEED